MTRARGDGTPSPALQDSIVAHLRSAAAPVPSRDLAERFLRIRGGDEATCHRLLAPLLREIPQVVYRAGQGWIAAAGRKGADRSSAAPGPTVERPGAAPDALRDFVAIAADGVGPRGSGAVRTVCLLPVVAGEECQEENFPSWAAGGEFPEPPSDNPAQDGPAHARAPARRRDGPALTGQDLASLVETIGELPVVCHRAGRELTPVRRACAEAGVPFDPLTFSVSKLGHILLGLKANHAAVDLSEALGVETHGPDDCRGRVRMVARSFLRLLERLEKRGIRTREALWELQEMPAAEIDMSRYAFSAEDLRALPSRPGVYRFRDRRGEVIYIGKAKTLRSRVTSYFTPSARRTAKGRAILDRIHSFDFDLVASELEAILLEAALLCEHRPSLNRQFDIHERPAPYGPHLNLAVVLRDVASEEDREPTCTIHLMREGHYLRRLQGVTWPRGEAGLLHSSWESVKRALEDQYFTPPADSGGGPPKGASLDWQLVGSFLRRHRDEVSFLDLDDCESLASALDRLSVLVDAAVRGDGRVEAR